MKRPPATSPEGLLDALSNAAKPLLEPPAHTPLRERDEPFWPGIVRARARGEWTEVHLVVAVQLARCQADIEREQTSLDAESTTIENAKGTVVMNPRVAVLEQLARREMALMRSLGIAGIALGPKRLEGPRRQAERQAEALLAEMADGGEDFLR